MNKKSTKNPKSQSRYGVDLNIAIKKKLNEIDMSYQELANQLKISKNGAVNRVNKPWYGTFYDVIEISLILNTDFITPALSYLAKKGVEVNNLPAQAENAILKSEISKLNEEIERYKKIVDKFTK